MVLSGAKRTKAPEPAGSEAKVAPVRRQENKQPRTVRSWAVLERLRQRPTLPQRDPCSTIGAERLDDRVRDGIGYGPLAIVTGKKRCIEAVCMSQVSHDRPSA